MAEPVITVETDKTENVAVTTEESTVDTTEATVTQVPDSRGKSSRTERTGEQDRRFRQQTGTQRRWTAWQSVITESEGRQFPGTVTQTAQTEEARTADTQDIMRQIMDYMKVSVKADQL